MKALLPGEHSRLCLHCEDFVIVPASDDPFVTQVLESSRLCIAEDARTHPLTNKDAVTACGNVTMVCVPVTVDERAIGVLGTGTFGDEGVHVPDSAGLEYLEALAEHVGVAMDRVYAAGERCDADQALRTSEQRYRRFVETSVAGVWAQDERGLVTYASEGMAALLSCPPQDMAGRPVTEFVFEEDLATFEEFMKRRRQGLTDTYELRLRRTGSPPIWLLLSATPILDAAGEFRGSFAMATDISKRKDAEFEREELLGELKEMLSGIVDALSATTSERDPYTAAHQARVARLTLAISERMGLDGDVLEGLRIAALLHDIGKIAVPAEILAKPATLSEMEMGVVRVHPSVGHRLLAGVRFARPVAKIVLQHHERLDGSGYPDGLTDEEILLEAKILAVADVVEAMASHRPYRPALGIDAAIEEIQRGAGTKYDAGVVAACVGLFAEDPAFAL